MFYQFGFSLYSSFCIYIVCVYACVGYFIFGGLNIHRCFTYYLNFQFQYKSLSLFPSQILVCVTVFATHYLFLRFDICWAIKQKHKGVGRYIGTSLCMYQNHQDYWLIIHDKLEDWFTTITHRCQGFSHKDRCVYMTS